MHLKFCMVFVGTNGGIFYPLPLSGTCPVPISSEILLMVAGLKIKTCVKAFIESHVTSIHVSYHRCRGKSRGFSRAHCTHFCFPGKSGLDCSKNDLDWNLRALLFTEYLLSAAKQDNGRHPWAIFSCKHPKKSSNLTRQQCLQQFSWRSFGYGDFLVAVCSWQHDWARSTLVIFPYAKAPVIVSSRWL